MQKTQNLTSNLRFEGEKLHASHDINKTKYIDINEFIEENNLEIAFILEDKITFFKEGNKRNLIDIKTVIKDNEALLDTESLFQYSVWNEPTIDDYRPNANMIIQFLSHSIEYINFRFGSNFKNIEDVLNGYHSDDIDAHHAAKYLLNFQLPPTLKLYVFQALIRIIGYHQITCQQKYKRQDLGLCERIGWVSSTLYQLCESLKTGEHGNIELTDNVLSIHLDDSVVDFDAFKFGGTIEINVKDLTADSENLKNTLDSLVKDSINLNRDNTIIKELFSSYFKYDV